MGGALALDVDAPFCELHVLYVCLGVFCDGLSLFSIEVRSFLCMWKLYVICACARVCSVMGFIGLQFSVPFWDNVRAVRDMHICFQ